MNEATKRRVEDIIYDTYGVLAPETIAKHIARETGVTLRPRTVKRKAVGLGIRATDAQGYITLSDAARMLGLTHRGLTYHLGINGYEVIGRAMCRFITPETFDKVKAHYKPDLSNLIRLAEVYRRLNYSRVYVTKLIHDGRIKAIKRGAYWYVTKEELQRIEREGIPDRRVNNRIRKKNG